MTLRILIVEDQVLFAEAIRLALEERDMVVVGMATTGAEAISAARTSCPDLVLVDIVLPDRSGVSVGKEILRECPDTKVLALTVVDEPRVVREALRSGFHGYMLKDVPVARFVQTVEAVMLREKMLNSNVDFFSATVYASLGIPVDLFTPVIAASRIAGWSANLIEQYDDNRLIRPRADYKGYGRRAFIPLNKR